MLMLCWLRAQRNAVAAAAIAAGAAFAAFEIFLHSLKSTQLRPSIAMAVDEGCDSDRLLLSGVLCCPADAAAQPQAALFP